MMLFRCQGALLIVALAVSPLLGWFMQGSGHNGSKCNGTCCPKQAHALAVRLASHQTRDNEASCRRGAAQHWSICLTKSSQAVDYEVVAPLRPATLTTESLAAELEESRGILLRELRPPLAGFVPIPFEPPRG